MARLSPRASSAGRAAPLLWSIRCSESFPFLAGTRASRPRRSWPASGRVSRAALLAAWRTDGLAWTETRALRGSEPPRIPRRQELLSRCLGLGASETHPLFLPPRSIRRQFRFKLLARLHFQGLPAKS